MVVSSVTLKKHISRMTKFTGHRATLRECKRDPRLAVVGQCLVVRSPNKPSGWIWVQLLALCSINVRAWRLPGQPFSRHKLGPSRCSALKLNGILHSTFVGLAVLFFQLLALTERKPRVPLCASISCVHHTLPNGRSPCGSLL